MTVRFWLFALFTVLIYPAWSPAQGRLEDIRDDIRTEEENFAPPPKPKKRNHCHCDDNDNILGAILGAILFGSSDDDDDYEINTYDDPPPPRIFPPPEPEPPPPTLKFPCYPYPLGLPGYMQVDPMPVEHLTGQKDELLNLKPWAIRVSIEDSYDFHSDINRFNGRFFAETRGGLGLHTSWDWLHEDLPTDQSDDAVLGNIMLTYRFIEDKHFLMRWGVGVNLFSDDYRSDAGLNWMLGLDVFPCEPWVVSSIIEGGWIGNTGTWHTQATAGYLFRGFEIYVGYDFRQIGSNNIHGPLAGLRLWF